MGKMLVLATMLGCVLSAQPCPTMEVSIVADKPEVSTRRLNTVDGRIISLNQKPLLTIGDFTNANVSLTEGQIVLNVKTTTDGARRIQTFTEKNVGRQIAFAVNGRLIKLAKILDPITGTSFMLSPFARDEAEKLAASINNKENGCRARDTR